MNTPHAARLWRAMSGFLIVLACLAPFALAEDAGPLDVHEWGTFTALQNEKGDALPGINTDDQPLPDFCHDLIPYVPPGAVAYWGKGAPRGDQWVTLRLETPVLYFHPAANEKTPFTLDVSVKFHGGWLTEFYPHADPDLSVLHRGGFPLGRITPDTLGSLTWRNVEVGANGSGPKTADHVWLAPRQVRSAMVRVPPQLKEEQAFETEQFLFYRGVGNRPVPLRVSHDKAHGLFSIRGQCADVFRERQSARISGLWLVHIRNDGTVAYRALDPITLSGDTTSTLATTPDSFAESKYSAGHLDELCARMHEALVADGLNADEAAAMLQTWKQAYFQSPGLRLFFLVPRAWTDAVLPLKLSRPARIQRVMMGRIELISPEQRQLLQKLSTIEVSDPSWLKKIPDSPNARLFHEGRSNFGDLGVKIPEDYQTYLDLGRFRNALVLAEQRAHPTPQLGKFIRVYGLRAYQGE